MRAFTSFNYWMKWVLQQRPLPPIFDSTVCPSTDIPDKWFEAKTPPSLRTHQNNDQCFSESSSVVVFESLKDGVDYTGSINPMRFDMMVKLSIQLLPPCERSSWGCKCRCSQYRWNPLCRWNNVFTWSISLLLKIFSARFCVNQVILYHCPICLVVMKMPMLNLIVAVVRQSHTSVDGSGNSLRGVDLGVNLGFIATKKYGSWGYGTMGYETRRCELRGVQLYR